MGKLWEHGGTPRWLRKFIRNVLGTALRFCCLQEEIVFKFEFSSERCRPERLCVLCLHQLFIILERCWDSGKREDHCGFARYKPSPHTKLRIMCLKEAHVWFERIIEYWYWNFPLEDSIYLYQNLKFVKATFPSCVLAPMDEGPLSLCSVVFQGILAEWWVTFIPSYPDIKVNRVRLSR